MDLTTIPIEDLRAEIRRRAVLKAAETRAKKKAQQAEDNSQTIEVQGRIIKVWKDSPWFFTRYYVEINKEDYYKYVKKDEHSEWYRKTEVTVNKNLFTFKTRPMMGEICTLSVKKKDFERYYKFDRFNNTKIIAVRRLNIEGE